MDSFKPRSILYVPGDSPKKLAKAAGVPADGFIIEWEDAVAEDRKDAARVATIDAIPSLLDQAGMYWCAATPPRECCDADAEALRECRSPWCRDPEVRRDRRHRADAVRTARQRDGLCHDRIAEWPAQRLRHCTLLVAGRWPDVWSRRLLGVLGIVRSAGEPELAYARGHAVNAARAAAARCSTHLPCSTAT